MKKFSLFLLVIAASVNMVSAQGGNADKDNKAKKILKNVSKKYKSFKTIKADFSVTNENPQSKKKDKQTGTIHLKGPKYKLEIAGQEVTCDGKTVWTFLKETNEVQITKYDPQANEVNPNEIFTLYEKGFLYRYVNEATENGKVLQLIELTPNDKKKIYFKIKLFVDKTAQTVQKLIILNKDGSSTTYEIIRLNTNLRLEDKFFTFDAKKHPGVRVDDLRP